MNTNQFNKERYNRKKQKYRFILGIQQLLNHYYLNLLWIPFVIVVVFMAMMVRKFVTSVKVHPIFENIFPVSMALIVILISIIVVVGIIQFIGYCFAIKDEADIEFVFDERDIKNQPPVLIYKKKDRRSGVVKREFYSAISMERWQEKKESICDRMNIHLVGDITYGGKKKNRGDHIYFESAKGRSPLERGVLYDDIL